MGVSLRSKNKSVDFTYSGFFRLRSKVAELQGGDVAAHYAELRSAPIFEEDREEFFRAYDAETARISMEAKGKLDWLLDFLYRPDAEGRITIPQARRLLKLVEGYDDGVNYGYAVGGAARFEDFVEILEDVAATKKQAKWS